MKSQGTTQDGHAFMKGWEEYGCTCRILATHVLLQDLVRAHNSRLAHPSNAFALSIGLFLYVQTSCCCAA